MLSDAIIRVRALFRRRAVEEELDAELRFHFDRQVEKYLKSGLTRDEALRRTRIEFGGIGQVKEECREARGVHVMEALIQDIRYGLRTLRKSPGFTVVALLTLALGIGANTAIFSVVYGVLLRPLPYKDPARLMVLNETTPKVGMVSVSYPDYLDWRAQSHSFSEMAAVCGVGFNLSGVAQPESIGGQAVSPNFLTLMGVRPFLGRDFDASMEKAGAAPVVLLSYALWQSHFGGDPNALGRAIALDGRDFTITGVLPPDFRLPSGKTDVLEPIGVWLTNNAEAANRGDRGDTAVVARLAPAVSFQQARAEMDGIAARLAKIYPGSNDQFGAALRPVRELFTSDIRPAILVLFAAVLLVLLIACANVANLCLMRGASRSREIALRIAIGASRGRIVRQMLAESMLLAVLGGVLGLALATGGVHGIERLVPTDKLAGASVSLNGVVLLFAAGIVALSAFLFGVAPALRSARAEVQSELKESGRSMSAGAGQNRWRAALVTAEVSLALVLLVGAGLMMKSLFRLLSVDPGFQPARVLTMSMELRTAQYGKDPAILNFWQTVLDRVRALPGVEAAALGTALPLTDDHSRSDIFIEGSAVSKPGGRPHPDEHIVSPGYLSALGIRRLRGRAFVDQDNEHAPRVAMINALLAHRLFSGQDPVGKRFHFGGFQDKTNWIVIVGVVGDTKLYGLANPARLEVYLPFRQSVSRGMSLVVKSGIEPDALTSSIRAAVSSIDKDQPVFAVVTMRQLAEDSVSIRRITLILLGLFSGLALVLAAIGIYGVISYSVAQRQHEIGIRMALGAQRNDVLGMILAQGFKIAGVGAVIGIAASLAATRLMANLLFSVSAFDPVTLCAVAAVLMLVAMLACYLPARRTLRVDPMIALRHE